MQKNSTYYNNITTIYSKIQKSQVSNATKPKRTGEGVWFAPYDVST